MNINNLSLSFQEKVIFALRELYRSNGYSQYRMSKFEEYDLYAQNKDFLISDSVITFTDTNGKLMALKPDVTLSIIKNIKDRPGTVEKLFYNENVYRISKDNQSYKEIMQVGLECIGDVGSEDISQVLTLAGQSLLDISDQSVLNVTNLNLLAAVLEELSLTGAELTEVLQCIEEKNLAGLQKANLPQKTLDILTALVSLSGPAQQVLPQLKAALEGLCDISALTQLESLLNTVEDVKVRKILRVDFSTVSDMHYYNGIVFKGYIAGVPTAVLSGGQYDKLMG